MAAPILVIGATGTVGREVVHQLTEAGQAVRALIRTPSKATEISGPLVEFVPGDLADPGSLRTAFEGVDHALLTVAEGPDFLSLVPNFISAAREAGTSHLVKVSAMGASPNSPSLLLRLHGQADDLIIASGLQYTILRPNYFAQNLIRDADAIALDGVVRLPLGDASLSYIDVRDIAAVAVKALTEPGHSGRIYTLTGPQSLNHYQVAEILSRALETPVQYESVSFEATREGLLDGGVPQWLADSLVELLRLSATGVHAAVTDDVERLLGRSPISLEQFARDNLFAFHPAVPVH